MTPVKRFLETACKPSIFIEITPVIGVKNMQQRSSIVVALLSLFLGLSVCVHSPTATAASIQFSDPIKIGTIFTSLKTPRFTAQNALPSSVDNTYFDFGQGIETIRVTVTGGFGHIAIGFANDESILTPYLLGIVTHIYGISSNFGRAFYIVSTQGSDGNYELTVFGSIKTGKFVQFIDNEIMRKRFPPPTSTFGPWGNTCEVSVEGDSIIVKAAHIGNKVFWERRYVLEFDLDSDQFKINY